MVLSTLRLIAADTPASVMAYKNSGRLASPTNLFYTNLVAGTNIIFEPIGSGRLKIHGTGSGGLITSVDPDFFEVLSGVLGLTNRNLLNWSQLPTNAFPSRADLNTTSNALRLTSANSVFTSWLAFTNPGVIKTISVAGDATLDDDGTNIVITATGGGEGLITDVDPSFFVVIGGELFLANDFLLDWSLYPTNTYASQGDFNSASNVLRTAVSDLQSATNGLNARAASLESVTNNFLTTNKSGFSSANGILTSLLNSSNPPIAKTVSAGVNVTITDQVTNLVLSATAGAGGIATADAAYFEVNGGGSNLSLTNQNLTNWAKLSTNAWNNRQAGSDVLTNLSITGAQTNHIPNALPAFWLTNVFYVDATNGNDATAVFNDITHPWRLIDRVITNASTNALVYFLPGFYPFTNIAYLTNITLMGSGPYTTILKNYASTGNVSMVAYDNTTFSDLQITNVLMETEFYPCATVYGTNVVFFNFIGYGDVDCILAPAGSKGKTYYSEFHSKWDAFVITSATWDFYNSWLDISEPSDYDPDISTCCNIQGAIVTMTDCLVTMTNQSTLTSTSITVNASGVLHLTNTIIRAEHQINIAGGATVATINKGPQHLLPTRAGDGQFYNLMFQRASPALTNLSSLTNFVYFTDRNGGSQLSLANTNGLGGRINVYAYTNAGAAYLISEGSNPSSTVPVDPSTGAYVFPNAVTTNLIVPLVCTLKITNGLIMAIGPP